MQRIMHILQAEAAGGMESYCVELSAECIRRGHDVAIVIPEASDLDVLADRAHAANVKVIRLDTDARRGRLAEIRRLVRLARTARRWHADIVHLHTGRPGGGLAALTAMRIATPARLVVTEHDTPITEASLRTRVGVKLADRIGHALIAVSRRNARIRSQRVGANPKKFAAILNGIPIHESPAGVAASDRERTRRQLGITDDTVLFGCVVRFDPIKGLDILLRAFARVHQAHPCELVLVGDGPLRDELEALAVELGVREHVHFTGFQRDPMPYFHAMDAFVLAVPDGSMSIALLEAMAESLPCVITFGGDDEAVIAEETGLRAAPNDPASLAAAMRRLAQSEATRERLGTAAAAHVRRHFSIQRVTDDVLSVYESARHGAVPADLRASAPPNPRPGDRARPLANADRAQHA